MTSGGFTGDQGEAEWRASQELLAVAEHYRLRAHRSARAQYLAGKHADLMHIRLGAPVVLLSAFAGSAAFASLASIPSVGWRIATGLVSIGAGVLAAFQTFFEFQERANKHRSAGTKYSALKRELDLLLAVSHSPTVDMVGLQKDLERLLGRISKIEEESLDVPDSFYDRARAEERADTEGT